MKDESHKKRLKDPQKWPKTPKLKGKHCNNSNFLWGCFFFLDRTEGLGGRKQVWQKFLVDFNAKHSGIY